MEKLVVAWLTAVGGEDLSCVAGNPPLFMNVACAGVPCAGAPKDLRLDSSQPSPCWICRSQADGLDKVQGGSSQCEELRILSEVIAANFYRL